jgi:hypothetical protein
MSCVGTSFSSIFSAFAVGAAVCWVRGAVVVKMAVMPASFRRYASAAARRWPASTRTRSGGRPLLGVAHQEHDLLRARRRDSGQGGGHDERDDGQNNGKHSCFLPIQRIIWSTLSSNGRGIVNPSAFAVLTFSVSSSRVGCCTGRSPARAPFLMRSM